jgi:hypothetical protein
LLPSDCRITMLRPHRGLRRRAAGTRPRGSQCQSSRRRSASWRRRRKIHSRTPYPAAKPTIRAIIPEVIAAPRRCLRAWHRALASVAPVRERPFPNSSDHNSDRY